MMMFGVTEGGCAGQVFFKGSRFVYQQGQMLRANPPPGSMILEGDQRDFPVGSFTVKAPGRIRLWRCCHCRLL
jgi:hypothetical protein